MLTEGMFIAERYEIIGKIGAGGMSDVYKAKDHVLGRFVAIKVLKNVDDIGFVYLDNRDVVRHPLVQKIVKAYEDYENKQNSKMRAKEHEEKTRKPCFVGRADTEGFQSRRGY